MGRGFFGGTSRPARSWFALVAASIGLWLNAAQVAFASAGCDAVNAGGFNDSHSAAGPPFVMDKIRTINGFAVGDRIDFAPINAGSGQWYLLSGSNALLRNHMAFGAGAYSYTVTGTQSDVSLKSQLTLIGAPGQVSVTATCTPATPPQQSKSTDSDKLRAVQIQGSALAAQISGAAITDAVNGAIGDAFGGGNPVAVGANGVTLSFGAAPARSSAGLSDVLPRTNEMFAAPAYAGAYSAAQAPQSYGLDRRWSAWLDVRGSGWDRSNVVDGTQLNVTGGIGYRIAPDVLFGIFGGYEDFRYDFAQLPGGLKGDGATVGGYAAWRLAPAWRWDAMLGWSSLSYEANAGTASGSFDGSRGLMSTGFTGSYRYAAYILEPSAKVFALKESQDAWADTLGTLQADRSFSTGRVSLGGRLIAPSQYGTFSFAPYVGFYGDWRFSSDDALPVNVPDVGLSDGWSGRVTGGVSMATTHGGTLSLGGEYGGIGASYGVWTGSARAHWPF